MIECYTDGATSNNGQKNAPGGAAFMAIKNNKFGRCYSEYIPNATNNICELTAILRACEFSELIMDNFEKVIIYSDSAYAINCYEKYWWKAWECNGWVTASRTPVKNKELWLKLIKYFKDSRFIFKKVKGHSNNEKNNLVDELAVKAKYGKIICEDFKYEDCCC